MVRPQEESKPYVVTKADADSFGQTPAGLTTFEDLKVVSSPSSLPPNTTPK
jgi:hypothetical protein